MAVTITSKGRAAMRLGLIAVCVSALVIGIILWLGRSVPAGDGDGSTVADAQSSRKERNPEAVATEPVPGVVIEGGQKLLHVPELPENPYETWTFEKLMEKFRAGDFPDQDRDKVVQTLLRSHANAYSEQLFQYFHAQEKSDERREALIFLAGLSPERNEKIVTAVLEELPPGGNRDQVIARALQDFNPDQFRRFLDYLKNSGFKEDLRSMEFVVGGVAFGNKEYTPEVLRELLEENDNARLQKSIINALARRAIKSNEKVLTFEELTAGFPAEHAAEYATQYFRSLVTSSTTQVTVSSLVEHGAPDAVILMKVNDMARRVHTADDALKAAQGVPDSYKKSYVDKALGELLGQNSIAVSDQVSRLPQSHEKDLMAARLAEYSGKVGETETAQRWLQSIVDPKVKEAAAAALAGPVR